MAPPAKTLTALFLIILTALGAAPLRAEEPAELARVEGLPAGDVLNLRDAPSIEGAVIGALEEGTGPIEILETRRNGKTLWARISSERGEAWAARRYLAAVRISTIGDTAVTLGLHCGGTEPFWGVELSSQDQALWRDPEREGAVTLDIEAAVGAAGRIGWPAALQLSGEGLEGVLLLQPSRCSDGMSDRIYPWAAYLIDQTIAEPRLLEGCCGHRPELAPR